MFAGYVVTYWNHETRSVETDRYETAESVLARDFDALPGPEELADDLYEVFGDVVGTVADLEGTILLDRKERMEATVQRWAA